MINAGQKLEKQGIFNKDLQSLVSKLEILRSFSVSTSDIMLAEQIAEAMPNKQESIGKNMGNIHLDLMHIVNLPQCVT